MKKTPPSKTKKSSLKMKDLKPMKDAQGGQRKAGEGQPDAGIRLNRKAGGGQHEW